MITCARKGCEETTERKTHNQKYCSDECCRLATNQRIMEKYYQRRDQRLGKVRYCSECTTTKLSRYNDTLVCSSCEYTKKVSLNKSVVGLLDNVVW